MGRCCAVATRVDEVRQTFALICSVQDPWVFHVTPTAMERHARCPARPWWRRRPAHRLVLRHVLAGLRPFHTLLCRFATNMAGRINSCGSALLCASTHCGAAKVCWNALCSWLLSSGMLGAVERSPAIIGKACRRWVVAIPTAASRIAYISFMSARASREYVHEAFSDRAGPTPWMRQRVRLQERHPSQLYMVVARPSCTRLRSRLLSPGLQLALWHT